jgi:hypothetical protein
MWLDFGGALQGATGAISDYLVQMLLQRQEVENVYLLVSTPSIAPSATMACPL